MVPVETRGRFVRGSSCDQIRKHSVP
ncbi:hypothetical protein LINPERPRIM_LOCUS19066 [Linum perenne]